MKNIIWVGFKPGSLSLSDLPGKRPAGHGADCTFSGLVRNLNAGREVVRLSYDINQSLAESVIRQVCQEAFKESDQPGSAWVAHAFGDLLVGDTSVLVRVSTPHRREAFKICHQIIDQLKVRAPIWKKEYYTDGESEWLEGHALCQHGHTSGHSSQPSC